MKVLNVFCALCLISFLASCGGDSCEVADWVGTYTLDEDTIVCDDESVDFPNTFVITAAEEAGSITLEGDDFVISESCTVTEGDDIAELDGDEIKITIDGCTATYK